MSVNIKYKDTSIAKLTYTGTKTLKTAGKYCEADIVVENTKDSDHSVEDSMVTMRIGGAYTNDRVTSIGDYAFYNCDLRSVSFPAVIEIGDYAFYAKDYVGLKSIDFPAVNTIGSYAFYHCGGLESIDFPDCLSTIQSFAFARCSSLTSVTTGKNMYSIEEKAFESCAKMTALVIRNTSRVVILRGPNAFSDTPIASGTGYIYVPDALVDKYKAATNWSTYAARIKPLSEYTDS